MRVNAFVFCLTSFPSNTPVNKGGTASLTEFKASVGLSAKGDLFDDLFCRPSSLDEALTTEPGRRTPDQVWWTPLFTTSLRRQAPSLWPVMCNPSHQTGGIDACPRAVLSHPGHHFPPLF